jgi:hypothetical protein
LHAVACTPAWPLCSLLDKILIGRETRSLYGID